MFVNNKTNGFALLELIVVIFISSIFCLISFNYIGRWINNIDNRNYINSFIAFIDNARAMSLELKTPLIIIPCANSWDQGLKLFFYQQVKGLSVSIICKSSYLDKINKAPKGVKIKFTGFPVSDKLLFDATDGFWVSNGSFSIFLYLMNGKNREKIYHQDTIKINKAGFLHR